MINTEQCKFLKCLREQPVRRKSIDDDFAESLLKSDYVKYIEGTIGTVDNRDWKGLISDFDNAYLQITQTGISAVEEFERAVREEFARDESVRSAKEANEIARNANRKAHKANVIAVISLVVSTFISLVSLFISLFC